MTVGSTQKRLRVSELRPGMVLARTVLTESGVILLAKDAVISVSSYTRLAKNNIRSVYVKEQSIDEEKPLFSDGIEIVPPVKFAPSKLDEHAAPADIVPDEKKAGFQSFQEGYHSFRKELSQYLLAVGGGYGVDADRIFGITDTLNNFSSHKSDVFEYLNFIKEKDAGTYAHSANVALIANLFGHWLNMDKAAITNLTLAGTLHDIGKAQIPPEILNKKGKLTDEEYALIKKHPLYGYRMVENRDIDEDVKYAILMHHERIDGTGYPLGVRGTHIREFAKIITICDIYDAMTSDRIYRGKTCPFDVIKWFQDDNFGVLDQRLLHVFLQNIAYTYVGSDVILSDGSEGEVIFINRRALSRPMVRVEDEIIDLSARQDLTISQVL